MFTTNSSGSGQGAIVNSDGTPNGPDHPATRGSYVSVYGTGDGQSLPAGTDGVIIGGPSDLRYTLLPVTASIGGISADVTYSGSAGGQVAGLFQANITIPLSVTPGSAVPITMMVGTRSTQAGVTIAIQ